MKGKGRGQGRAGLQAGAAAAGPGSRRVADWRRQLRKVRRLGEARV